MIGARPGCEAEAAERSGHGQQHARGRGGRHTVAAEDEHRGGGAHGRAHGQLSERDDRDEHGDRVEERGVDAHGVQQEPVAEDLREHRDEHESDHAASSVQAAKDREAAPQLPALAEREAPEAGAGEPEDRSSTAIGSHHGRPRGPIRVNDAAAASIPSTASIGNSAATRVDTCGQVSGRGAPQGGDARGHAQVAVQHAAEDLHARRAVEDAARDGSSGRLDRDVPRLAARHQRDGLQEDGHQDHPGGDARQRRGEFLAAAGEQPDEHRGGGQRSDHGEQRAVAATEPEQPDERPGAPDPAAGSPWLPSAAIAVGTLGVRFFSSLACCMAALTTCVLAAALVGGAPLPALLAGVGVARRNRVPAPPSKPLPPARRLPAGSLVVLGHAHLPSRLPSG